MLLLFCCSTQLYFHVGSRGWFLSGSNTNSIFICNLTFYLIAWWKNGVYVLTKCHLIICTGEGFINKQTHLHIMLNQFYLFQKKNWSLSNGRFFAAPRCFPLALWCGWRKISLITKCHIIYFQKSNYHFSDLHTPRCGHYLKMPFNTAFRLPVSLYRWFRLVVRFRRRSFLSNATNELFPESDSQLRRVCIANTISFFSFVIHTQFKHPLFSVSLLSLRASYYSIAYNTLAHRTVAYMLIITIQH